MQAVAEVNFRLFFTGRQEFANSGGGNVSFLFLLERGTNMKEGIHPEYKECKVTCACGNSFTTLSDKEEMRVDICSECHPFFTGQQKFANRGGRVEKFKNKYGL